MTSPMSDVARWELLSELVADLAELTPDARAAALDSCADDVRREVLAHLAALDQGGALFLESAATLVDMREDADDPASPKSGDRYGAWEITRLIGRGGMGAVYEGARIDGGFVQHAAIKTIAAEWLTPTLHTRFQRERQLLARLKHRNIATVLDGGVTEDGRPWFAMELIDGEPITTWCNRQRLGVDARLALFRQVCGAVHYAHSQLVVHRDLKPANILVTNDGTVKLLDFGVASILQRDDTPDDTRGDDATVSGAPVPMTPTYASPEQLAGEAVTVASDVYSLGVVLHELLAGVPPFPRATSVSAQRSRVEREDPASLTASLAPATASERGTSLTGLRRALRGDVARVVAMALRREPDRRYASAEQLGADIANVVARRPVIARDTTLPYHIGRFVARNRIATALSATLLLAVIVAAAMAIDRARSAEAARAVAVTEARRAERVTEFLSGILRSPDPWTGDRDVMVGDVLDAAAERAGRDFGNDSATLGTIRLALAGSYRGLGRRTQAAAQYLAADSILASAGNSRGRIEARRGYAELQGDAGNLVSARAWYDSASQMASRSGDSLALAAVDADLAWLHVGQGALDSARVSGARALALRRRLGASAVDIANSLNNLAVVELEQGKPEDATRLLNEAVTLLRSAGSEGRAALGAALSTLGGLASDMGNRALADTQYRESLRLRRDVFGAGHPDEIGTLVNLAANALEDGRAAEALTLTDTILARIVPGGLPSEHPLVGAARTVRGRALVATGNLTAGTTELRNALALRRRTLPPGHPSLAYTLMALAEALDAGQHRAEAQAAAREAQRVLEAALGGEHPRTRAADALVRRLEANRNGAR